MNEQRIKQIVIVGGGSAGWITAGTLGAQHNVKSGSDLQITLVESPQVAISGVGEGTWPSMRNTLDNMGINESDFIRQCDVSFKQGSKFIGWKNGQVDDVYFHPFVTPPGYLQTDLYAAWQRESAGHSFADAVSVQSHLCMAGRAPKQFSTPDFAGVVNYGYHLDASKFASYLQQHCVQKLGVRHIVDHVSLVLPADNGDIAAIVTQHSGTVCGDLFVDCSGEKSLLLGQHYHVPFIDKNHILFNDTALAAQVPYAPIDAPISSATLSTAQTSGWIWDIGLPSRRGVGHTFSSAHCSDEQAELALREYLAQSVGAKQAQAIAVRKLSFTPGYRATFWHQNCVAIGMSAGFIEPLEASALALVELGCTMLSDELPVNRVHMDIVANRYNKRFHYRWERVIEFLKLHYVLSARNHGAPAQNKNVDYWQDNQALRSIPERLQELLTLWRFQSPSRHDFVQNEEVFPSASYQYVLYGMGFTTQSRGYAKRFNNAPLAQQFFQQNQQKYHQFLAGLPSNRDLIEHICQRNAQLTMHNEV